LKETRDLKQAAAARRVARATLRDTTARLRGRLAPRLLAADLAEVVAARASRALLQRGIARKRRIVIACGAGLAIATAIVLRATQRIATKKNDDLGGK